MFSFRLRSALFQAIIIPLMLLALTGQANAGYYDAASDFSLSGNPNGVWSYGYSLSLGSPFILYTNHGTYLNANGEPNGLEAWNYNISLDNPAVVHNGTGTTIDYNGTAQYLPGQLGLHPGPDGEYSIIQFTAPTTATYNFSSAFSGLDFVGPTTTDIHVLLDGVSIFNGTVDAFGVGPSFSSTLSLTAGEVVAFEVGYGSNDNFLYDSTGLTATFASVVPEPSSVLMVGMGILGFLTVRRRRARAACSLRPSKRHDIYGPSRPDGRGYGTP